MEFNDWAIGVHKDLNKSPVQFDSARMVDVYYNIVQRFNYQLTPSINISKEELYKIANFEEQLSMRCFLRGVVRQAPGVVGGSR